MQAVWTILVKEKALHGLPIPNLPLLPGSTRDGPLLIATGTWILTTGILKRLHLRGTMGFTRARVDTGCIPVRADIHLAITTIRIIPTWRQVRMAVRHMGTLQ